jgi:hypothetical protein
VLAFERDGGLRCVVNIRGDAVPVPEGATVLVRSDPGADPADPLRPDAAVWLVAS